MGCNKFGYVCLYYYIFILYIVSSDREDIRDPEVWAVFLDLYLFYLLHTKDVPDELHEALNYCGNTFWYLYDRNPYKVRLTFCT